MKRHLIIIVGIIVCANLGAQVVRKAPPAKRTFRQLPAVTAVASDCHLDSIVEYSPTDTLAKTIFILNDLNQVIREESWVIYKGNWTESHYYEYGYDEQGRTNLEICHSWDYFEEIWYLEYRYERTLNDAGEETLLRYYQDYDDYDQEWLVGDENAYTYLNDTLLLSYTYRTWDEDGWENFMYITYSYNADLLLDTMITSYWSYDAPVWEEYLRKTFTYQNGRLTQVVESVNFSGEWVDQGTTTNHYNEQNLLDTVLVANYISATELIPYSLTVNTYYQDGHVIEKIVFLYDTISSQWINYQKMLTTWDEQGNCLSEQVWIYGNSEWVGTSYKTAAYNAVGLLTETTDRDWNGTDWDNTERMVYYYDEDGDYTTIEQYSGSGSLWVLTSTSQYHYGCGETGLPLPRSINTNSRKYIQSGQLIITIDNKTYNAQGAEIN